MLKKWVKMFLEIKDIFKNCGKSRIATFSFFYYSIIEIYKLLNNKSQTHNISVKGVNSDFRNISLLYSENQNVFLNR